MKVLIICDSQNTFLGTLRRFRRDGDEFLRQALLAADWYGGATMLSLPRGSALKKRQTFFKWLKDENLSEFDRVLFFMHGSSKHLNRRMISDLNLNTFCRLLGDVMMLDGKVVFYSCKTAKLLNGFAANVAEMTGRDVVGHTTSGHTTRNPFKKLIYAGGKVYEKAWLRHGGAKALKQRFSASAVAPFIFVEELFK